MKYTKNEKNIEVDIREIKVNPINPRNEEDNVGELKDSIKSIGLLSPLILDENGIILSGHRRFKALQELGYNTAKCDIITNLSSFEKKSIIISANTTQKKLNTWAAREFIQKTYWDDFLEEYEAKNVRDNGYKEFSRRLGISYNTIKVILDASLPENKKLVKELKDEKINIDVIDSIIKAPPENRSLLKEFAIKRYKKSGIISKSRTKETIRAFNRTLLTKRRGLMKRTAFKGLIFRLESVTTELTEDTMKACTDEQIKEIKDLLKPIVRIWFN